MAESERSKRLRYAPPKLGVYPSMLIALLQRHDRWAWPVSELVRSIEIPEWAVFWSVRQLLQLGLVERTAHNAMIRIVLTPAGRRWRPPPPR